MSVLAISAIVLLALLGLPLFLILAGASLLGYMGAHQSLALFFSSNLGPIADNPLFLAIPLFTFAGYLMAESRTPQRMIDLSKALFGWMPGGMAIISLLAMAFFTAFTGASGVTIIALGGLFFPILLKDGYPEDFTLGLLTTGGSRGLTFPPSLPLIIFAMIAGLSLQGASDMIVVQKPSAAVHATTTTKTTKESDDLDKLINEELKDTDKNADNTDIDIDSEIDKELQKEGEETPKKATEDDLDSEIDKELAAEGEKDVASKSNTKIQPAGVQKKIPESGPGSPWKEPPKISVDRLFVAGAIPGLFSLILIILYAIWVGVRRGVPRVRVSLPEAIQAIKAAAWEIPIPFIIIIGIYGGFFTAVDAAAITAAYVFFVEVFVYRDLDRKKLFVVMRDSMLLVGSIMMILMSAYALTNYFIDVEIPQKIFALIKAHVHSKFTFLLFLNLFLLVVGCLMDIFSAILVVVPIIMPVALYYHVDPTHLGVIFLINLDIGYSTPPVGINLFIGALRFERPVVELYKATLPFLAIMLFALAVITYWPDMSLWLVRALGVP